MKSRFETGAAGLVAVVGGIVALIGFAVFLGAVVPVVNQHCVELADDRSSIRVDSGWTFYLTEGFPNPAPDRDACIRNTPTREALSALGIWKLESPEKQIASKLAEIEE